MTCGPARRNAEAARPAVDGERELAVAPARHLDRVAVGAEAAGAEHLDAHVLLRPARLQRTIASERRPEREAGERVRRGRAGPQAASAASGAHLRRGCARRGQRVEVPLDQAGVDAAGGEVGLARQPGEEAEVGDRARDAGLVERPGERARARWRGSGRAR